MQAEDMEVPIINNLNDNGDRLRPKGKDAFKDQQKESEVKKKKMSLLSNFSIGTLCVCMCVLLLGSVQAS